MLCCPPAHRQEATGGLESFADEAAMQELDSRSCMYARQVRYRMLSRHAPQKGWAEGEQPHTRALTA